MTTRRTLLKSLSLAPVALLAPKVALGMGVGPRLVERPWDALVGLTLNYIKIGEERATFKTTCGRTFRVRHVLGPTHVDTRQTPFLASYTSASFTFTVSAARAWNGGWHFFRDVETSGPLWVGVSLNCQGTPTLYEEIC